MTLSLLSNETPISFINLGGTEKGACGEIVALIPFFLNLSLNVFATEIISTDLELFTPKTSIKL